MKKTVVALLIVCSFLSGCKEKNPYAPSNYLSDQQKQKVVHETIRYSARLAPMANHENKFDSTHNAYYDAVETEYDLRGWFPDGAGKNYFLMTRDARSITPMREGIGGVIRYDSNGNLIGYKEIFRTWKMSDSLLTIRGLELFDAMVKKKDLTPYTTKYRADQYIEFPDERFQYDSVLRRWHDRELDSLNLN